MIIQRCLVVVGAVALASLIGCGSNGPAGATSSSPSAKPAAAASSSAVKKDDKKADKKKEKPKAAKPKPADAKKEASKGEAGAKDKPIPKDAKKADVKDAAAENKKKAEGAPANACADAEDGEGVCDVNGMYFCMGKELYVVDCDELGRMHGFDGGTCLDTGKEIDCMGMMAGGGDVHVYCDGEANLCCDSDGFCWADEAAGDPEPEAEEPAGAPPGADANGEDTPH